MHTVPFVDIHLTFTCATALIMKQDLSLTGASALILEHVPAARARLTRPSGHAPASSPSPSPLHPPSGCKGTQKAGTKKGALHKMMWRAPSRRRRPTLPHCGAVPSARPGLTSLFSYLLPASFVPVLLFSIIFVVLKLYIFWLSSYLFFCGSFIVIILLIPVCGIVYLVE